MEAVQKIIGSLLFCALWALPLTWVVQLTVRVLAKFRPLYGLAYPATFLALVATMLAGLLLLSVLAYMLPTYTMTAGYIEGWWIKASVVAIGVPVSGCVFQRMIRDHEGLRIGWGTATTLGIVVIGAQAALGFVLQSLIVRV